MPELCARCLNYREVIVMKKGISVWSMPAEWDFEKIFSEASAAGFEGVEIALGSTGLSMESTDEEILVIKEIADKNGIKIFSVATTMLFDYPLTSNDPEIREKGRAVVRKMIDVASLVGAESVLVVPGVVSCAWRPDLGVTPYDVAYIRALDNVRIVSSYAEEKGITIGIENVWNRFLLSPLEMRDFIDKVGSDYVKAYFDAGNVLLFGHPDHWASVLGKRITKVHIKDFKVDVGNLSGFVPLLEGDLDFPLFIKTLKEIGYDGWVTPEVSSEKTPAEIHAALDRIINS